MARASSLRAAERLGRPAVLLGLAVAVLLLPGCFLPLRIRASMKGEVVDARTGAPIAGAKVCVEDWRFIAPVLAPAVLESSALASTDAEGRYSIPGKWGWRWVPPTDGPSWAPRIIVARDGYVTKVWTSWRPENESSRMPRKIRLEPQAGSAEAISCPTVRDRSELPPEERGVAFPEPEHAAKK